MSLLFHNIYSKYPINGGHHAASVAQDYQDDFYWLRVEQRWNGHWLRPCVGMRADQASHRWAWNGRTAHGFKLEPRHD